MSVQATDRTQTAPDAAQGGNVFDRLFLEHPRDVKESYFEHFGHSASYGFRVLSIATCCFIHALIPGLHKTTASRRICQLAGELDGRAQVAREERCRQSGSYDPGL
jgi:hypothetical protein